jgi:two-component system sensor histidine kinase BaeS
MFAIVLVLISAMIAFPLSSIMVRPIRDIVTGTRELTSGDYSSRIKIRTSDELGLLSQDFNTLALTLEHNRHARQQWIADISHELRTPLAVLRGELESLQDGIRPLTPEAMDSLHHEVVHLNALVNDLHELSLSDMGALVYEKRSLDIGNLLEHNLDLYEAGLEKEDISVSLTQFPLLPGRHIYLTCDEKRLSQLFSNLLQNTCRYTEKGGSLEIEVHEQNSNIQITFSDSGPGVKDEDLPKLFDRLYRVENSRNREKGGSGLGLAICKNIVEAHEGTISSAHSPLGGLLITIQFPVSAHTVRN